jgi:hypothetical protein
MARHRIEPRRPLSPLLSARTGIVLGMNPKLVRFKAGTNQPVRRFPSKMSTLPTG